MDNNKVDFSFGWLALKLLGKSLYSNAWSAISELVANGFDARATKVYVYINAVNKEHAIIEIFDNGIGMDVSGIETYAKVGFNRRTANKGEEIKADDDAPLVMGRKGIGKLAALYLSEHYYLLTRTRDSSTAWKMVYSENSEDEDARPFLSTANVDSIEIECKDLWSLCKTGTLLRLNDVNLTGLGNVAFRSLEKKLANYFALDSMSDREILLCVRDGENPSVSFSSVKKDIAFKNMAFIEYAMADNMPMLNAKIEANKDTIIKMPYTKLSGKYYDHKIELTEFQGETKGTYPYVKEDGSTVIKHYKLTGWIGLHSTIEIAQATKNDPNFNKSKFYNPIQLRLYVRNKLAMENFLNVINNTQAFVNYVEGEIHFDILDDDDLPDIATSNRQSMDEHDPRIKLLVNIVSKIISNLIAKRVELTKKIKQEEDTIEDQQQANAKKQFSKEVNEEINKLSGVGKLEKDTLTQMVVNKIKGEVKPKSDYIVFISHSSADKCIADFFYHLLKHKGLKSTEFFYTSRDDSSDKYSSDEALAVQIKNNIVRDNTLLFYLTSKDYKNSEYCMFEGGAGWATRSVSQYIVLSLTYGEIPKFITNGKMECCLEKGGTIPFDRETYYFIRETLNRMIDHINRGRKVSGESLVSRFEVLEIPEDIVLSRTGQTIEDYMEVEIREYWDYYVGRVLDEYMEKRHNPSQDRELAVSGV